MNEASKRQWPFHGYAPGGYMCKCMTCKGDFIGDKRCITCAECAIKRASEASLSTTTWPAADSFLRDNPLRNAGTDLASDIGSKIEALLSDERKGAFIGLHQVRAIKEIEAAICAALSPGRIGEETEEAWCQPMDCGKHRPRKFVVIYEDADVGMAVFDNEAEAREHWEKATTHWNCYLLGALPLSTPAAPELAVKDIWEPTHQHVKRGSKYRLDGYGEIQTDAPLTDYAKVAIYRAEDGTTWVRPVSEFEDGRFAALTSPQQGAV